MSISAKDIIKVRKPKIKHPVIKEITSRFSPRHFSGEEISSKALDSILEAARLAPSAYNYQPWFFYIVKNNSQFFDKVTRCLPKFNLWAKTGGALVIACTYVNKGEETPFTEYDLGAAVMSLVLQAQHEGLYARQIGLFDKEKLKNYLSIDKDHQPFTIIVLGKLGDYSKVEKIYLDKDNRAHEKKDTIVKKL